MRKPTPGVEAPVLAEDTAHLEKLFAWGRSEKSNLFRVR